MPKSHNNTIKITVRGRDRPAASVFSNVKSLIFSMESGLEGSETTAAHCSWKSLSDRKVK